MSDFEGEGGTHEFGRFSSPTFDGVVSGGAAAALTAGECDCRLELSTYVRAD